MNGGNQTTLSAALWPLASARPGKLARSAVLVMAGVALFAISAQVKIPFWPVPLTLQTLVVLVIGLSYGLRLAGATSLAYVGLGAAGAPVFAAGGGWAYLAGPTGGYIAGFVLAAMLMGYMADRGWGRTVKSMLPLMLAGTAVVFLCGVTWLAVFLGDLSKALQGGLYPFILGEALKIAVAVFMVPGMWRMAAGRRS